MRIKKCSYRYLGADETVFPTVHRGTVLGTESTPMRVTLMQFDQERNKLVPTDVITNATVSDQGNGKLLLKGDSEMAAQTFPADNNPAVSVEIISFPCRNCG